MAKRKVVNQHDTTYQIHKVEHGTETVIVYDFNLAGKNVEKVKMQSGGSPKEGFLRALQDLKIHAMFAGDIPSQYSGGISVKSVAWGKKGIKFVIQKRLKKGGDVIMRIPEIELFNRAAKDQKHSLPEDAEVCLNTLRMAAIDYVKGERGQGPMFEETEGTAPSKVEVSPEGKIIPSEGK